MTIRHHIEGAELVTKREGKMRLRRGIFNAWGCCCAYCGQAADTLDHVRPVARGGLTVPSNLIPACRSCNYAKAHAEVLAWFRNHHGWTAEREARLMRWIG